MLNRIPLTLRRFGHFLFGRDYERRPQTQILGVPVPIITPVSDVSFGPMKDMEIPVMIDGEVEIATVMASIGGAEEPGSPSARNAVRR